SNNTLDINLPCQVWRLMPLESWPSQPRLDPYLAVRNTMKIQAFSNNHIEFRGDKPLQTPEADSDLVAVTGDIGDGVEVIEWPAGQSQRLGKQILYVPGNHEHYDQYAGAVRERAEAL